MNDDWREETAARLAKSYIYQKLQEKCSGDPAGSQVLSLVDSAVNYAYHRAKMVLRHMGEFTLHDGEHLFRVLRLMERLLNTHRIDLLSIPELMLLILCAFFHDIGMSPDEDAIIAWKKTWDKDPELSGDNEQNEFDHFKRFCSARPDKLLEIDSHVVKGNASIAEDLKKSLITEYIRANHGNRAREIIEKDWNGKILFRDTDLTVDFAEICFSHTNDTLRLLDLDKRYICGPDATACLPLIAVVLRISDILDFDMKRAPSVLFSHLAVRHPVSLSEWNKHRTIEAWEISEEVIRFHAKCTHPAIEASIHSFCNMIDRELSVCNNIINIINDYHKSCGRNLFVKIPLEVDRSKIETIKDLHGKPKYNYRETRFDLSKKQVIELLMGTKLYGDPGVALRELLQNSIDACLLRQALELKWGNSYVPRIDVRYYRENNDYILEVTDNGTGMDQYIIDNYYSKVGSSFYKSPDFYDLKSQSDADFVPTSRFGIGILSTFMVADTLIVDTRKLYGPHKSSEPICLIIEGQDSIFWIKDGKRDTPGTQTKLILRQGNNPWEKLTEEQFIQSVENVIPNPPFEICVKTESHESVRDQNSFGAIVASELRDYSWDQHENIRELEFKIDKADEGFVGSAIIGILEKHGEPVANIEMTAKCLEIDGVMYKLNKSMSPSENKIDAHSTSITINDDGNIEEENSHRYLCRSKCRLALHGIEVPTLLFPEPWAFQRNQVKISWPFPLLIVIDVCGNRDLDLNSARNQVIMGDSWISFEEDLARIVCQNIADTVSVDYWGKIKTIFSNSKNETFLRALNKVSKTSI